MSTESINEGSAELTVKEGVGTLEFFHPQSNSLPGNILARIAALITEAGERDDIKLIVLRSAGERAFCAGASFDELISIENKETGTKFFSGFANVINAARKCPKFIIGRVPGKAVGGGVGMAAATDYCFATVHADIKLSELAIGIGPFVVGPAVERKVGTSAFTELAINATAWRTASWAFNKGLFNELHNSVEEMDEAINNLSNKLANSNPEAMRLLKENFWKGSENWDDLLAERASMSGELVLSAFTKSAINKFKSKS